MFFRRKSKPIGPNLAGIIVDMMPYYLSSHDIVTRERMIAAQLNVIDFLSRRNNPIVCLENEERGYTIEEIDERVERAPINFPFVKDQNDGFSEEVYNFLRMHNVGRIVFMGINKSICVYDTANTALFRGFMIYSASDLISDFPIDHNTSRDLIKTIQKRKNWYNKNCTYYPESHQDLLKKLAE